MQLAEELYTMVTSGDPVNIPAGSTIGTPAPGQPYLTLPGYTQGDSIFNLTRNGQPVGNITVEGNTLQFVPPGGQAGQQQQRGQQGAGLSSFPGVVQSGGPGNGPYTVTIFPGGVTTTQGQNVSVTQLQIDAAASVPAGASVVVFQGADGAFFMQFPVWS